LGCWQKKREIVGSSTRVQGPDNRGRKGGREKEKIKKRVYGRDFPYPFGNSAKTSPLNENTQQLRGEGGAVAARARLISFLKSEREDNEVCGGLKPRG